MRYKTTRKLLAGALAAGLLAAQLPVAALAATDNEAAWAARNAVEYLKSIQQDDGSIAPLTDWAVVAIAASGQDPSDVDNGGGVSAVDNLATTAPGVTAADLERQIIAIAAVGKDTANFNGTNYNELLAATGNNGQIGDAAYLNDDIFGIIAAAATKDSGLQSLAQDGLDYMLAHQNANGGFSAGTDCSIWCGTDSNTTAAAIIALAAAGKIGLAHTGLETALANALAYLLSLQQTDGGFTLDEYSEADGASTAWSLMALNALGTNPTAAQAARDWLLHQQDANGRFSIYYPIFDYTYDYTADAAVALLGTTWLLDPEPLAIPAQPAETPTPQPTEQPTPTPVPAIPAATLASATAAQPSANTPKPQTLAAATTAEATQSTPTSDDDGSQSQDQNQTADPTAATNNSVSKYVLYAAVALALISFGWYLFQPKKS